MPPVLSKDVRVRLVRCYHETKSLSGALRKYRTENGIRVTSEPCSAAALQKLVKKFDDTGSVLDAKRSGRPALSDISITEILNTSNELSAENVLNISSAREVSRRLDMPVSTVRKVMRKTLELHPYHLKVVHELQLKDYEVRMELGLKCIAQIESDSQWISRIFWTDETHFYLHGGFNRRWIFKFFKILFCAPIGLSFILFKRNLVI